MFHTDDTTVWACLGTLISPNIVLTAAHCVHTRKPEQVLSSVGCTAPPCLIDVARVVNHESYSSLQPEQGNDIALVKLNKSLNGIEFVCLPTVSFHPSTLVNQNTFVVATNIHRKGVAWKSRNSTEHTLIEMPVMPNEECQIIFEDHLRVHEADVCAGGQGVEPCHGDSAAPLLVYDDDRRWTLVAIVTLGSVKCGDAPYPTVYTNVGAHLRWIHETQRSI
ncbi:hypothetical protein B566_EDAN012161 [Ephemera danica]|nr:hypothetical protein B566_EDAN012161 [Ephemera danica]